MLQSILLQMLLNSGCFSAHARRIQPAEIYFICWDIHAEEQSTCNCHSNSHQRYFSFCKALPFAAFLPARQQEQVWKWDIQQLKWFVTLRQTDQTALKWWTKKSPPTQNMSTCDPEPLLFVQLPNCTALIVAALLCRSWSQWSRFSEGGESNQILFVCFCKMTFFLPFTCKSLLFQFTHSLGFYCCPKKSVSVLLDLLFQFITQPPFTLTPACCQSLWPVWEPATAVQSFTYWTMVRGGISRISASPSSSALFIIFTEEGGYFFNL